MRQNHSQQAVDELGPSPVKIPCEGKAIRVSLTCGQDKARSPVREPGLQCSESNHSVINEMASAQRAAELWLKCFRRDHKELTRAWVAKIPPKSRICEVEG